MVVTVPKIGRPDWQSWTPQVGGPIYTDVGSAPPDMPATYVGAWRSIMVKAEPSDTAIWQVTILQYADDGLAYNTASTSIYAGNFKATFEVVPVVGAYIDASFSRVYGGSAASTLKVSLMPANIDPVATAALDRRVLIRQMAVSVAAAGSNIYYPPAHTSGPYRVTHVAYSIKQTVRLDYLDEVSGGWLTFFEAPTPNDTAEVLSHQWRVGVPRRPWRIATINADTASHGASVYVASDG